jgi:hypothetical protein
LFIALISLPLNDRLSAGACVTSLTPHKLLVFSCDERTPERRLGGTVAKRATQEKRVTREDETARRAVRRAEQAMLAKVRGRNRDQSLGSRSGCARDSLLQLRRGPALVNVQADNLSAAFGNFLTAIGLGHNAVK